MTLDRFFNTTGKRIKLLRIDLDLKQKEVVTKLHDLGVPSSRAHLSNLENSATNPSVEVIAALAKVLGTTTDYLLLLTDDPLPPAGHVAERTLAQPDRAEVQRFVDLYLDLDDDQRRQLLAAFRQISAASRPHIIGED